jgi:hypothetical protein
MDENPYRPPREEGAGLSRHFHFSVGRSILAIAVVAPGMGIFYGIWQIRTTQDLVVLLGALLCIPIAGALFGGALAVFLNPPTERRSLAITVGGMIVFLLAFGAWVVAERTRPPGRPRPFGWHAAARQPIRLTNGAGARVTLPATR